MNIKTLLKRALDGKIVSVTREEVQMISNYIGNLEAELKRLSILKSTPIEIKIED